MLDSRGRKTLAEPCKSEWTGVRRFLMTDNRSAPRHVPEEMHRPGMVSPGARPNLGHGLDDALVLTS
jgi:hypothetical protein